MKSSRGRATTSIGVNSLEQSIRKHGVSPLVCPAACGLIVFLPNEGVRSRSPARVHGSYMCKAETLVAAAQIVTLPTFVCGRSTNFVAVDEHRSFSCEEHGCIWKNESFRKALDAEDKSALVLVGYWLDHEVTVTALYALADCYDVFVALDASPARSKEAARLAETRLLHAGATPLLTDQLLREWIIETSSAVQRTALAALIE